MGNYFWNRSYYDTVVQASKSIRSGISFVLVLFFSLIWLNGLVLAMYFRFRFQTQLIILV